VKYIRNYDADTVTFDIPGIHPFFGKKINVRVAGVDTPEIRTKNKCEKSKARNAKKLVTNLLKNANKIDLINVRKDKYFRILADVQVDGASLSNYLLKNGLAYEYDGGTKAVVDWCKFKRSVATDKNKFGNQ
jgi:endonuclease YncB( thermonuclease family)